MVRLSKKKKLCHNGDIHTIKKSITNRTGFSNTVCVHRIGDNDATNDEAPNRISKVCSIRDEPIRTSRQTSLLSFFEKEKFSKSRQNSQNKNGNSTIGTKVRRPTPTVSSSSMYETSETGALSPLLMCHPRIQSKQKSMKSFRQVYIDCGQSKFGQILCNKCGMLYMPGIPEDEIEHKRLCQSYALGAPCKRGNVRGGKQVDVCSNESHTNCVEEATIVMWRPCIKPRCNKNSKERREKSQSHSMDFNTTDHPSQWPLLARMIAKDLGTDEATTLNHMTNVMVFLYIGKKISNAKTNKYTTNSAKPVTRYRILGVATIQILGEVHAYRMISLYERSRKPVTDAKLGVGLLWTHPIARNRGIATKLLHSARKHAIFGIQVAQDDVAFSNPTQAGYNFALRYRKNEINNGSDDSTKCKDLHHKEFSQEYDSIDSRKKQEEASSLCRRGKGPLVYEMYL